MKVARHEKIIELIHQYEIDTQEELASRLNEAGYTGYGVQRYPRTEAYQGGRKRWKIQICHYQ